MRNSGADYMWLNVIVRLVADCENTMANALNAHWNARDVRKLQSCIRVVTSIVIIIGVCIIEWKMTVCVLDSNQGSVLENVSHGQLPYTL